VNRLWEFSRLLRNTNRSLGDAAEMTEIFGIIPEVKDPTKPEKLAMRRGEVKFQDVAFAYPENQDDALFKGLSLKIKPGEKVGLVGPSGGGKTTITKLLLRFMDIEKGQISIDGQNIAAVKQSDLRSRVAYVSQEPILFHRSLAENIGYGDIGAEQAVIEAIAKKPTPTSSSASYRKVTKPWLANAALSSAAGSASGWRLPGRCSRTRRSWC